MANDVQEVVSLARKDLVDKNAVRFDDDDDLLKWFNDALAIARGVRPDLFFGQYDDAEADLALTDPFPLPLRYRAAFAHYIVSRAEMGDDEHLNSGRVKASNELFSSVLGNA